MATQPLGGKPLPFKIPTGLDAIKAIDAEFWRLHAVWRLLSDQFGMDPEYPDESPRVAAMADRLTDALYAMLSRGVWTAAALLMKMETMQQDGLSGFTDTEIAPGFTIFDMLKADCGRIYQRESGLWEPMLAL